MDPELEINTTACRLFYNDSTPYKDRGFILAAKVTVSVMCFLSILGALLIIFTYIAFPKLRTTTRQLLVNLSVGDIIVSASHGLGLYTNFDRFLFVLPAVAKRDTWCNIQAAFTLIGDLSVFLWTTAVVINLLVTATSRSTDRVWKKALMATYYAICWGIPIIFAILYGALRLYGFTQLEDVGWCFTYGGKGRDSVLAVVLGYSVWSYLIYIVLLLLYIILQCLLCTRRKKVMVMRIDVKLALVPVIFILLRLPSTAVEIPLFYLKPENTCRFKKSVAGAVLSILAGNGNSAQGLANAILFCLLTRTVRVQLHRKLCCVARGYQDLGVSEEVLEATTTYTCTNDSIIHPRLSLK